jgi:hypothetical protein
LRIELIGLIGLNQSTQSLNQQFLFTGDKVFGHLMGLVVGELGWGSLHEVGRGGNQGAGHFAV